LSDDVDLTLFLKIQELKETWILEDQLRPSIGSRDYFLMSQGKAIKAEKQKKPLSNKKIIELRKTKSIREIAEITGISSTSIHRICGKSNTKDIHEERNQKIKELHEKGLSFSMIAKETGVSKRRAWGVCNK
jgi:DNA invertase Pin-like site-specific DNA recombinase